MFVYLSDLHLDDIEEGTVITTKLLVQRATDAIIFRDDDAENASWEFS